MMVATGKIMVTVISPIRMRKLFPFLLLPAMLLVLGGCVATQSGFPVSKHAPRDGSTTTPSACLAKGKEAESAGDWVAAYQWYARGGSWNAQGRSTGFPSPGTLSEPEESQRFLCIAAFLQASQQLIAQGVRVDENGESPLYVSVSEASQTLTYFQHAHPGGYAGLTAEQMKTLVASAKGATMDTVEPVDHGPSSLQKFEDTVAGSSKRPAENGGATSTASVARGLSGTNPAPAIVSSTKKNVTHAEAARLYREAAARYPESDSRREEMLKLATEEERAAVEGEETKTDSHGPK